MIVVFVFILGLFVGSFLNVVIYRLHRQESFVKGFSKCLFCGHRLYTKDLVPLFSYFYLKGKCRYCRHRFSHQYPLVELATAFSLSLIFITISPSFDFYALQPGNLLQLLSWWVITSFLIVIFVYDLKYYLILDIVIFPIILFSLLANIFLGYNVGELLLAAIIGGGFFGLQFILSKGRWIGGGDIRLGFLMGIILGWPHIFTALFIAYIIGSLVSIFLLIADKKKWGDKIPFGTFLTLATFITLLYGDRLIDWYLSLFI